MSIELLEGRRHRQSKAKTAGTRACGLALALGEKWDHGRGL